MHKMILANAFAVLMVAFTPATHATVITTGVIDVFAPHNGAFRFNFVIGGLEVSGSSDGGSEYFDEELYEGVTFVGNHDNNAIIDMFAGSVAGVPAHWRSGSLFMTTAAGQVLTSGQTTYYSSFDFTGHLCGTLGPYLPQPCFITFPDLTGQGIAEFLFRESILDDGRHYFTPLKATYTFHPVPEPTTVALFGLSILGVMTGRRSKRKALR